MMNGKNTLIVKYILYASRRNIDQLTETDSQENWMAQMIANGMWRPSSLRSWVESRTCWKQLEKVFQDGYKVKRILLVLFITSSLFLRNIFSMQLHILAYMKGKKKMFSISWRFFHSWPHYLTLTAWCETSFRCFYNFTTIVSLGALL